MTDNVILSAPSQVRKKAESGSLSKETTRFSEMNPIHLKKLSSIKDEVNELHPLLRIVLGNMPSIRNVYYTHGPYEKGADFVCERYDDDLNVTSHIGVVAKVGNLNKSEEAIIYRQIKECGHSRPIEGGKKKIALDEVWVVTTGNISNGLKEYIAEEFVGSKLHLFDRDKLASLVDGYAESFWSQIDVQAGDYLSVVRSELAEIERMSNLLLGVETSFYIPLSIYKARELQGIKNWKKRSEERVNINLEAKKKKAILVEGAAGSGKSKVLRELCRHLCEDETFSAVEMLPILVTAVDFVRDYSSDFGNLIKDKLESYPDLQDGKKTFLVALDGLDELDKSSDELETYLEGLIKAVNATEGLRLIVSTRFLNDLAEDRPLVSGVLRVEIQPLSRGQIIQIVRQLCADYIEDNRFFEDMGKSELMEQMPKNPICALLLAGVIRDSINELPSTIPELYKKYFELAMGRWDFGKGLEAQKEYEALEAILMNIASYFMENQLDSINLDEAKAFFSEYLDARKGLGLSMNKILDGASERCELISISEMHQRFQFRHRSFFEFLYAKKLWGGKGYPINNKIFDVYWRNSFYFYVGLKGDCPELLEESFELEPNSDLQRLAKSRSLPLFMQAAFRTPDEFIVDGVTATAVEMAKLFVRVKDQKEINILSTLPELYLLWFVKTEARSSLGYMFFKESLVEAQYRILDLELTQEEMAYGIFFLDIAQMEIGGEENFGFLLTESKLPLPLPLRMGLTYEAKGTKSKSDALRRHEKMMGRSLKNNPKLRAEVEKLKRNPILGLEQGKD